MKKEEILEYSLYLIAEDLYREAAEQLHKTDERKLQAECETIAEFVEEQGPELSDSASRVITGYEDRIIDELLSKAYNLRQQEKAEEESEE